MAESIIHVLLFNFFFFSFEPDLDLSVLANSGFASEGTTAFRCDIASEGIAVFRSEILPLNAKRMRDFFKLLLSTVCCNKFLTLWDLVSSVF